MHTIETLFDWFLSATLRGSLLIPAVLLVQMACGRRLPAGWRHALWLPVLFVLGSPVLPESPFSLEQTWARNEQAPVSVRMDREAVAVETGAVAEGATPLAKGFDWRRLPALVWLAGVGLTFAFGLAACRRTLAKFRRRAVVPEASLAAEIRGAAEACGLRRVPGVVVSPAVPGPAMSGFLRPVLLLPADFSTAYEAEERRLILLHEFTHVKRGDLVMNWIVFALQSLHWCNPIVWFAVARFRADRELACDSAVLAASSEDRRAVYGHALLKVEAGAAPVLRLGFVGLVGLFGRGRVLQSRIGAIARHRPPGRLAGMAGMVLLSALVLVGATKAQNEPAPARQILIEAKFVEIPVDAKFEISSTSASFDSKNDLAVFSGDSDVDERLAGIPDADVLSTPRVVTVSGQKATIEIGQTLPQANGEPEFAGIRFEVLPTLKDGGIDLALHFKETEPKASDPGTTIVSRREIETQVKVRPGDTLLLGSTGDETATKGNRRLVLAVRTRFVEGEAEVRERLGKIIIPSIEFRDTPLSEALAFMRKAARDFDPEKMGVSLVHQAAEGEPDPLITVSFKDIPLTEALKYLAALSGLEVTFGDPSVILKKPGAAPAPDAAPPVPDAAAPAPAKGKTEKLAATLILPKLEIKETPLPDVLQYFQQRSVELDPAKQGINLILNAPGEPAPDSIRISLSLTSIPLSEALRYTAELSNLKVRYDDEAVVLFRP